MVDSGSHTGRVTNPPPYQPLPVYLVPTRPPRSSLATWSLALALIGATTFFCTFGVPSLLAIGFGHTARGEIKRTGKLGLSHANAGLILGYPIVILMIAAGIVSAAR